MHFGQSSKISNKIIQRKQKRLNSFPVEKFRRILKYSAKIKKFNENTPTESKS